MKTLLMINLMLLSLCPAKGWAQTLPDTIYLKFDGRSITYVKKPNNQSVHIGEWRFASNTPTAVLKYKIDSLEKRIVSLEKMVKVLYDKHVQDSLYYQRLVKPFYEFLQLDSIVPWPNYNDYKIVPLSNMKRKYKVK